GPTAWRKPASACSPSLACRQANGRAPAPPTPSSVCTRSSSGGSRRRPCCHRPRLRPCCSGRCSQQARSRCARLTAGTHLASPSPTNPLTSPHEPIISNRRRAPRQIQHSPRRHPSSQEARLNALSICETFSEEFSPKTRSALVDHHQEYKAKGDDARQKASRQFFEEL